MPKEECYQNRIEVLADHMGYRYERMDPASTHLR